MEINLHPYDDISLFVFALTHLKYAYQLFIRNNFIFFVPIFFLDIRGHCSIFTDILSKVLGRTILLKKKRNKYIFLLNKVIVILRIERL